MSSELPQRLQDLARGQVGVVSRQQALKSGMAAGTIDAQLKSGRWRALYRATYITHNGPLPRNAQLWAAVLYAGRGARLSHETAAEVIDLTDRQWPGIQVSIPPERRVMPVEGVVIHNSSCNGKIWRPPPGIPPHTSQARDNANAVTGATLRYGWNDVTRKACETALQEAEALRSRGWTGTLKPCSPACRASYPVRPAIALGI